jgi:hypothetical protein
MELLEDPLSSRAPESRRPFTLSFSLVSWAEGILFLGRPEGNTSTNKPVL